MFLFQEFSFFTFNSFHFALLTRYNVLIHGTAKKAVWSVYVMLVGGNGNFIGNIVADE